MKKQKKKKKKTPQLGLSTQPGEPTNPSNPPKPEPKTIRIDHSDVSCGSLPIGPDTLRVGWRVSSPKRKPPDLIIKPKTSDEIRRIFDENLQKPVVFGVLRRRLLEIPSDPTIFGEISSRSSPDLTRSDEISMRSVEISSWSGQISTDSAKITSPAI